MEYDQDANEAIAQVLERMAADLRSGNMKITHVNQEVGYQNHWKDKSGDAYEFFRIGDSKMELAYHYVQQQEEEKKRLEAFLKEHPDAEKMPPRDLSKEFSGGKKEG